MLPKERYGFGSRRNLDRRGDFGRRYHVGIHGYEVRKSVPTGSPGPQGLKAWVDRDPTVASLENDNLATITLIAGKVTVVTAPGYADVLRLGSYSSRST